MFQKQHGITRVKVREAWRAGVCLKNSRVYMISCRHGWNSPFHTSCLPAPVWACYCCSGKWVYPPELVTAITGIQRNRIQSWCLCPFSLHVCNSSGIKGQTARRHSHTCTHVGHPLSVCERRLGGLMNQSSTLTFILKIPHLKHCSWTWTSWSSYQHSTALEVDLWCYIRGLLVRILIHPSV